MRELFDGFAKWGPIVAICYTAVLFFELLVVFPLERMVISEPEIASVIWLPHAASVLSTVIVGPRAFFALFPTFITIRFFQGGFAIDAITSEVILGSLIGAICAPIAYLLVDLVNRQRNTRGLDLENWRTVLIIGAVASIINSILRGALFGGLDEGDHFLVVMSKVFVGDLVGLMLGLVFLVFLFRIINRSRLSEPD